MHEISITVRDLFFFYQQFASLSLSLCVSVFFRTKHVLLSIWMCICWHSTMPFSFNVSFHSDISLYYCFVFFPLIPSFCSFCSMSGTSMLKTWQKPFGNMEKKFHSVAYFSSFNTCWHRWQRISFQMLKTVPNWTVEFQ